MIKLNPVHDLISKISEIPATSIIPNAEEIIKYVPEVEIPKVVEEKISGTVESIVTEVFTAKIIVRATKFDYDSATKILTIHTDSLASISNLDEEVTVVGIMDTPVESEVPEVKKVDRSFFGRIMGASDKISETIEKIEDAGEKIEEIKDKVTDKTKDIKDLKNLAEGAVAVYHAPNVRIWKTLRYIIVKLIERWSGIDITKTFN